MYTTSRRLETMDGVAHPEGNIHLKEMDVTSDESVERAIQEVIAEAGRLDIVVSTDLGFGLLAHPSPP